MEILSENQLNVKFSDTTEVIQSRPKSSFMKGTNSPSEMFDNIESK
jgi:hypothetical protein